MKKLLLTGLMLTICAGMCAAATEIYSENTVGVMKVDATTAKTVVPVPFVAVGTGADTAITGGAFLHDHNVTDDDLIYQWQTALKQYFVWTVWDGEWIASEGESGSSTNPGELAQMSFNVGEALWYTSGTSAKSVYVMGQIPAEDSSVYTVTVQPGEQKLLANPLLDKEFDLNAIQDVAPGDTIQVCKNGVTVSYNHDATGWCVRSVVNGKMKKDYSQTKIPPQGGNFWYNRSSKQGTESLVFNWNDAVPVSE